MWHKFTYVDCSPIDPEEKKLMFKCPGEECPYSFVKGGVKLDHWGGEKVYQFTGGRGLGLKDLRGWLERRPATRLAGRV